MRKTHKHTDSYNILLVILSQKKLYFNINLTFFLKNVLFVHISKIKSFHLCKYTVKCGFMQKRQKSLLVILHNEKGSEKISEPFVRSHYVLIANYQLKPIARNVSAKLAEHAVRPVLLASSSSE